MTPHHPTRDRLLEAALARVMGGSAPAPTGPECLDAESVAAWLDGGLDAAALAMVEAHAASCARCRGLAAALATDAPVADRTPVTDAPAVGRNFSSAGDRVVADRTPVTDTPTVGQNFSSTSNRAVADRTPVTDAPAVGRNFSSAADRAAADRAAAVRAWRWWLAPLAAAAAIATWMIVPASPPASAPPMPTAQIAQAPAAEVAQAPAAPTPPPGSGPAPAPAKPPEPGEAGGRTAALRLGKNEAAVDARADAQVDAVGAGQPKAVAEAPAPTLALRSEERAAAPPAEPAAQAVAAPALPAPLGRERALVREVASPDRAVRWRVGEDGTIDRTTDAGRSWARAAVEAGGAIMAGASPSPTVCWLVGREGLVLVTTDGTRFARVAFPVAVDLVFVQATGDRSAVVTTADAERFVTADGGRTWTKQ